MKDYRDTQMPVEWDHDTYHQDDEKIIFYCPNCHEALADFPTYMLDEEVDCNEFSNECVSAFAYEHLGDFRFCVNCGQRLGWKHCKQL